MSNLDEGNAFLGDVNSIIGTLMCGYYKATKDYNPKCQNAMRVLLFYMMLVVVYMFYYVNIVKQ
jgi:hypothetical protein